MRRQEIIYDIFAQEVNDNVYLQINAGWILTGGENLIHYITEYPEKVKSIYGKTTSTTVRRIRSRA